MLAIIFMAISCVSLYGIATVIDRLDKIIRLLEENGNGSKRDA